MRKEIINLEFHLAKEDSSKRSQELKIKESIGIQSTKKESNKILSKKIVNSSSSLRIIFFFLFIKFTLISCQDIIPIKPFENYAFDLNEKKRYVIYEFKNDNNGTIHTYFKNGNILSTKVAVYYDKNKINFDENNQEFVNYEEQKSLYKTTNLTFNAYIGNMYFVISNFNRDFTDIIQIINNLGYYDSTNKETFKYLYKFNLTKKTYEKRIITFSFKNDIKKNYLYYQIDILKSVKDYSEITTKDSKMSLKIIKLNENTGIVDLSSYKNETINIKFELDSYVGCKI